MEGGAALKGRRTRHLKGFLVLKGAGSQLTGAEELIQGESLPLLSKVETLKQFFMKGKLNPTSQSQEKRIYQRAEDATG